MRPAGRLALFVVATAAVAGATPAATGGISRGSIQLPWLKRRAAAGFPPAAARTVNCVSRQSPRALLASADCRRDGLRCRSHDRIGRERAVSYLFREGILERLRDVGVVRDRRCAGLGVRRALDDRLEALRHSNVRARWDGNAAVRPERHAVRTSQVLDRSPRLVFVGTVGADAVRGSERDGHWLTDAALRHLGELPVDVGVRGVHEALEPAALKRDGDIALAELLAAPAA